MIVCNTEIIVDNLLHFQCFAIIMPHFIPYSEIFNTVI